MSPTPASRALRGKKTYQILNFPAIREIHSQVGLLSGNYTVNLQVGSEISVGVSETTRWRGE